MVLGVLLGFVVGRLLRVRWVWWVLLIGVVVFVVPVLLRGL